jgi:acyl-CoA thioesterase-1
VIRPAAGLPALLAAVSLAAASLALPGAVGAQTRYLAVGDSITFGVGDDPELGGYPARLEPILADRGMDATVENLGIPGETSAEALSRIDEVLAGGGDVLLLMEGTNDVGARLSPETVQFNLRQIAERAADAGLETVHLTVVPRLPSAAFDGSNQITGQLAGQVRELAWETERTLADPFEVFLFQTPDVFDAFYVGGDDKLHPNAAGYDLLAELIADALTGVDTLPPVTGIVRPENDAQNVDPLTRIRVDLYDFGAGIDLIATELVVNDEVPEQTVSGDERRVSLTFDPTEPLEGVVFVGVRSQDLGSPPRVLDRRLVQFVVAGTQFLPGDIDRDGRVDGVDLVAFAVRFGAVRGEGTYRLFADFNGDGVIDGEDLAILASNFGKSAF